MAGLEEGGEKAKEGTHTEGAHEDEESTCPMTRRACGLDLERLMDTLRSAVPGRTHSPHPRGRWESGEGAYPRERSGPAHRRLYFVCWRILA